MKKLSEGEKVVLGAVGVGLVGVLGYVLYKSSQNASASAQAANQIASTQAGTAAVSQQASQLLQQGTNISNQPIATDPSSDGSGVIDKGEV